MADLKNLKAGASPASGLKPGETGDSATANRIKQAATAHKNGINAANVGNSRKGNAASGDASEEQNEEGTNSEEKKSLSASSGNAALDTLKSIANNGAEATAEAAKEELKKAVKKKILTMIAPAIPYILIGLGVIFVIIIVMVQVMLIKDQVREALGYIYETSERITNFISGKGWNTSEEEFFEKLKLAYLDYHGSDGEELDIPLVASTIQYTYYIDVGSFDGEDYENEEEVSSDDELTSDDSIFGNVISSYQTHTFYDVANVKLGNYKSLGFVPIGSKGLLGHLIYTRVYFKTEDNVSFTDALQEWVEFFKLAIDFNFSSVSEYIDANDGDNVKGILNFLNESLGSVTGFLNVITNLNEFMDHINSFANNGQSYSSWVARNFVYELKEFFEYLTGNYNDEKLIASTEAYYNSLEGTGSNSTSSDICNNVLQCLGDQAKEIGESIVTGNFLVPHYEELMDYKGYYRYLVNIYIPETYFYGSNFDIDANYGTLIKIANEIFDQKYMYDDLISDSLRSEQYNQTCNFDFSNTQSSVTSSVTTDMLDNVYVNVLDYGVKDLNGKVAETVPLKDYIAGVLYREVSATMADDDDYLIANIIAIKSFTISRRELVSKDGKYYITMKNSTDDQVYCSVTNGCLDAPNNKKAAPSTELVERIENLYESTKNYFIYNSESESFLGYYRSTLTKCLNNNLSGSCLGQTDSQTMGNEKDYSWQNILAYFYKDPNGLVDISTGSYLYSAKKCISNGLNLGLDGYYVRTSIPTKNDKYFSEYYLGSGGIGQCVWYAKGRALEIIANSHADETLKEETIAKVAALHGNGADWTTNGMCNIFACSDDYTQVRPGSMGVYYASEAHVKKNGWTTNYGHVVIVEQVIGDTVVVTDGWNGCGGANGTSSWDCVRYRYQTLTIEQMKNFGSDYIFRGYVYLLD